MKAVTREERRVAYPFVLIFLLLAAGIAAAATGLLALLGWVLDLPRLASFGADLIPMAPSTALLFLLYGIAVCLRTRMPLSHRTLRISVAMVGLGTMVALLLFALGCLNIHWEVEHLGLNITHTVGKAPVGHMSPVSAFCFLLASMSFLGSLSRTATRPWRSALALGSAGMLVGTCFIFLLAYFYGTPLLYGGRFIPPALNTVLAFVMLGLALLALAVRMTGLFGGLPGDGSRTAFAFALIFVLLASGIVTVGYRYYRNYERNYYSEAEHQLSAIAELKVDELAEYRKERLGDAATFFNNTAFSRLVGRFLDHPEDADAQQQVQEWAVKYMATDQYDLVRLIDAQGVIRMSAPAGRPPLASVVAQRIPEVLRSGQVTLEDFHRNEHDQRIYLTLLVPILDGPDHSQALGVLALRIDPETYLYPFIKRWPTPSRTAETLLIRREGNEAVFLNELRFQTNTALNLRSSLENTNMPAVKAALGQEGIVEGTDYRGVPVIAEVRSVPDSPWFMVARMDTAEVYAPLRERLRLTILLVSLLLISTGLGIGAIWRHQHAQFYKERYKMAEALREGEARYRAVVDSANDAIVTINIAGEIAGWNGAAQKIFHYTAAEMLGQPLVRILPRAGHNHFFTDLQRIQAGSSPLTLDKAMELAGQRKDGSVFPMEISVAEWRVSGERFFTGTMRDITARKGEEVARRENEERLRSHADNSPMAVVEWNADLIITRWTGAAEMMFGWSAEEAIGKPITELPGICEGDLPIVQSVIQQLADGVSKHVFSSNRNRTRNGQVIHCEWYNSVLHNAGGKMTSVLSQILDITARERADEALANERAILRTLVDNLPAAIYLKDLAGRKTLANRVELDYMGVASEAEVIGKTDFDFFPPEQAERYRAYDQEVIRSGQPVINREGIFTKPDGSVVHLLGSTVPLRDAAGHVTGLAGINYDVTDRKRAEEQLLKVITQTRCILCYGKVEGPKGWRERALEPNSPFHWDTPVLNEKTAQKIVPLELAAGEQYLQAWERSWNRADAAQMNWNSGNAFLNDLPFYRNEFRCIDKNGVGHWMQESVTIQKLAENRWQTFSIATDISDLKRVETELRESQALYHSLVDQMPAGVFRKDAKGRFLLVNSVFCRLKEMTPDRFLGKTVLEVGSKDVALATKSASHHATIMQSGNQIEDEEVYTSADGEARNYHAVKSPVFDSAGKIVGTQGVLFDITDRKRAEQGLEQAFQRQRGISWLHESLLASRPLRDKLQLVTETIVRLFDADFCRIWLARPGDLCEQGCMHAQVTEGPHACRHREMCLHLLASAGRYTHLDGAKHRRVPYGAYKIGLIAAGKETKFLINDVQQNPRVHDRAWAKELGLVSFAGYRLQSPGGVPLGVLALFAKRPLTPQEDVLLEGLSNATTSILLTQMAEDETRRELTERKRAEEALRWSETHLQVILESTDDGILAVDNKGKVIKANRRFAELWRIPQSLMDAGDDRALLDFVLEQLSDPDAFLKKEQSLYNTDAMDMDTLAFKDGRIFERYYFPMIMDGAVIGRVWSFRDITERKQAVQRVADALNFNQTVLRTSPVGIVVFKASGPCLSANEAIGRTLGGTREEVLKQNFRQLESWKHSGMLAAAEAALDAQAERWLETQLVTTFGKKVWLSCRFAPFHYEGEPHLLLLLGDITERKRQEEELKQKNSELERFTYTVSHDLKSPLVTVKTFLGYLEQDVARPDMERVKQDVAYMHTATEKMGQLLDELLNLARVGRKENPAVRVTFRELAQEAVRLVAGRISTGGVKVQVADAVVTLEGDRPRLMEIWQNLVENACKFMGNQPEPQVEIGVEQRGPETVFFVRDNGAGIDPRYQAKVFGLFEQLNPKGEGTGMGLALVKRIVELYEGRIWVESGGPGQGANFLFTLPGAVILEPEQSS